MREPVAGTTLAWDDLGTGDPVVLIHGLSESRHAWRHQTAAFARRFRVIACDVRGFGESETSDADGRLERYADDVRALLVHLGIARARIVGFSMGGVIAQRFAIDHSAMIRVVVIAASSSVVNRQAVAYYRGRADVAEQQGLEAIREASAGDAGACFALAPPEVVETYRQLRRAGIVDPRGYMYAARAMASLHEHPLTKELGQVRCPTLVITGERDVFCPPRASEIIAGAIPGSILTIVPAVGHCLHWDDPARFNEAVLEFLASA
jgi:3-oxoadipate enol-lactonase